MSWFSTYVRSSIGKKQVMALTGLGLVLFAIVHMVGHLGMFAGQDGYNSYAAFLQGLGALKWVARGGLLAIFLLHMFTGISLAAANRAARPVAYAMYTPRTSTPMSRYMAMTGVVIFAFVVYHLMHFTFGQIQPEFFHLPDPKGRPDAYTMFVRGFQSIPILISYAVAVFLLSAHLAHGASSWLQSLGLRHPKYKLDKLGPALTAVLFIGYMAPPLAVVFNVIRLPGA